MKKIKAFLSPAGRNKLAAYTRKQGPFPLCVVGVHVNETELICSEMKQASGQKSTGLTGIFPCRKKVEWQGITDFVVPPNCLDFLCAKEHSCRDVLSAFLKESVLALIKKPVDGAVIVAFSFPVHSLWDDSTDRLWELLDGCFADCDWILPAVVSVLDHAETLCVYVDKNWTTFHWGRGEKTSVSYGTATDFRDFRCNDYLDNATDVWDSRAYLSWEAGLLDICRALSDDGKDVAQNAVVHADEAFFGAVQDGVLKSNLAAGAVSRFDPSDLSARILLNCLEKADSPKGKGTANKAKWEHPVETTEDLFNW